jgi:cellulose synthase/poly-beta-1,6-N-acetylglucosamine synthase-like glycosyltransferase
MSQFLTAAYTFGFLAVGLFGLKACLLVLGYLHVRRRPDEATAVGEWPVVTVQLPIYNERLVAARVIDAACRIQWPRGRLEVQVLDDSTDATREIVDATVEAWQARGVDVHVLRRSDRAGFKAGALAHGTRLARGDVLAVFDADFVPPADFLLQTVPFLGPGVAAVQARWSHLNADQSWLTRVQALALDGHFVVEQTARARNGFYVNFNGTAGIWRRAAITAAGGWQGDTLSEDIDLSYRAQLAGWRLVFLPDVAAPAELPTTMLAFKRQQRRWSKGTTQLLPKLGGRLALAHQPLVVRVHAVLSLTEHLLHPITVCLVLGAPLLVLHPSRLPALLGLLWFTALAPAVLYAIAAAAVHHDWRRRMLAYPLGALLSIGLCVNGTVAVCEAIVGRGGSFERTPKVGDGDHHHGAELQRLADSGYLLGLDRLVLAETVLAVYCWLTLALAVQRGNNGWWPFLGLFGLGFTLTASLSLYDNLAGRAQAWRTARSLRRSRGGQIA